MRQPHFTPYHSQLWAHSLTLRGNGGDLGVLSQSISAARVDLNPHQVDAALFALRSPLAKGAILADEVGLGTLEAQKLVRTLDSRRKEKRKRLYEEQDAIDAKRDALIADIERRRAGGTTVRRLFALRWRLE